MRLKTKRLVVRPCGIPCRTGVGRVWGDTRAEDQHPLKARSTGSGDDYHRAGIGRRVHYGRQVGQLTAVLFPPVRTPVERHSHEALFGWTFPALLVDGVDFLLRCSDQPVSAFRRSIGGKCGGFHESTVARATETSAGGTWVVLR